MSEGIGIGWDERIAVAVLIGYVLWLLYDGVKRYGWQSIPVRACMFINGMLSLYFGLTLSAQLFAVHQLLHCGQPPTPFFVTFCMIFCVWYYLLVSPRGLRWMMLPRLRWASYAGTCAWALVILAIRKGWF